MCSFCDCVIVRETDRRERGGREGDRQTGGWASGWKREMRERVRETVCVHALIHAHFGLLINFDGALLFW